ncbi:lamin-1-like [Paramacrobiotus metropolitanus]|uniref:lamin-1-like n=1 Tax=Paramacrobiotus metropolitanus TaxID=2943436 RepID=UPI002445A193|nr:lamin-1-like [Paramacrobiotus metropolitanus]XP_055345551.1 lamin-1-like [Paramacrobiotus metropolitanus]
MDGGGVVTRSRQRQRSESQEPVPVNAHRRDKSSGAPTMDAVPEQVTAESLSTPSSQSSQKSYSNGIRNGHHGSNGFHMDTPPSSQSAGSRPLSPTSMTREAEKQELQKLNSRLAILLSKLHESNSENITLKEALALKEGETQALLDSQLAIYQTQVRSLSAALDQENNQKVQEIFARERAQAELQQLTERVADLQDRFDDAENRAKGAEKLQRESDRKLADAQIALNEANMQKMYFKAEFDKLQAQLRSLQSALEEEVADKAKLQNQLNTVKEAAEFEIKLAMDRLKHQAIPIDSVDASARRSFNEVNLDRIRENFQQDMEDQRQEIEEQLHDMYQRKIEDMSNQMRIMEQDLEQAQRSAVTANKNYRDMSQQLSANAKVNREIEDDLARMRAEFDRYKENAEGRLFDASNALREKSHMYQEVLTQNQELRDAHADILAELRVYDELMKSLEQKVGIPTPERSFNRSSVVGNKKRKHSDFYPVSLEKSASRMGSFGRPSSSQTTVKASANKSRSNGDICISEMDPGKFIRIENTAESAADISGYILLQQGSSGQEVKYTFEEGATIAGNGIITVYGPKIGDSVTHNGTTERVADEDWITGHKTAAYLYDATGRTELASYQTVSEVAGSGAMMTPQGSASKRGLLSRILGRS